MCARANRSVTVFVLAALLLIAGLARPGFAAEALDICSLVSSEQLAALHRKPLYPKSQENGCYWSREPGTMAYLHIGVLESAQPLRQYFHPQLSATTTLEPIIDLGDARPPSSISSRAATNSRCCGRSTGTFSSGCEAHRPPPERLPTRSTAS